MCWPALACLLTALGWQAFADGTNYFLKMELECTSVCAAPLSPVRLITAHTICLCIHACLRERLWMYTLLWSSLPHCL